MDELIRDFKNKMHLEENSKKTVKIYIASVKEFFRWFNDSFGDVRFKKLYRENILEYKSYLKNVKTCKRTGQNLNAKSINAKLSALIKYNELMQPDNIVISKADLIRIQVEIISPTNITKKEVEGFRQRVLQSEGCSAKRNYAIVTIMAYAGLRISEVLHLKKVDVNTAASQIRVADGKGEKQRTVIINSKAISAIRKEDGIMREGKKPMPVCEKYMLTIKEAAEYFNIGIKKMRRLAEDNEGEFAIYMGNRYLVIRERFEQYIVNLSRGGEDEEE